MDRFWATWNPPPQPVIPAEVASSISASPNYPRYSYSYAPTGPVPGPTGAGTTNIIVEVPAPGSSQGPSPYSSFQSSNYGSPQFIPYGSWSNLPQSAGFSGPVQGPAAPQNFQQAPPNPPPTPVSSYVQPQVPQVSQPVPMQVSGPPTPANSFASPPPAQASPLPTLTGPSTLGPQTTAYTPEQVFPGGSPLAPAGPVAASTTSQSAPVSANAANVPDAQAAAAALKTRKTYLLIIIGAVAFFMLLLGWSLLRKTATAVLTPPQKVFAGGSLHWKDESDMRNRRKRQ